MRRPPVLLAAAVMAGALATGPVRAAGAATTALTNQASASGFPVGVALFDVATLGLAVNPTGTLTFALYAPDNPSCSGPPVFISTRAVTGNGNYTSDSFTSKDAGTYRWTVRYSGDAANTPAATACGDPAGQVMVGKRKPTLNVSAAPLSLTGTITATATLGNGAGPSGPTGTLTFKLYGPNDLVCGGAPVATSSRAVSGNGAYSSEPFAPSAGGTYQWVVSYSGDSDNFPASTICVDPAGTVVATPRLVTPTLTVSPPRAGRRGEPVRATASLGGGLVPTGTLTFSVHGPEDRTCSAPPVSTSTVTVAGNGNYSSGGFTPPAPGTYRWVVRYGGDLVHTALATKCGEAGSTTAVAQVTNDYDGDGDTDVAVYRPSNGGWYVRGSSGVAWGVPGDIPVPGDYDGDGDTDVAVYRPSDGCWYLRGVGVVGWGGAPGDIPVPGDYDGDGDTDIAIYRASNGGWHLYGTGAVAWGAPGDIPVPGDYDGDGDTDIAVYRPSDGHWYVKDGAVVGWGGVRGDIPVPGDYDGDGDTDVAVYRTANGGWHLYGIGAVAWGAPGADVPVPGDYNGDGRTDIGVYRPSESGWYLKDVGVVTWGGVAGDVALALPTGVH